MREVESAEEGMKGRACKRELGGGNGLCNGSGCGKRAEERTARRDRAIYY
jgi:hypothetical protein